MPKEVPRIALVDYANREVTDTLNTIVALQEGDTTRLNGIRVDTCGENLMQGGSKTHYTSRETEDYFMTGEGVTTSGIYSIARAIRSLRLANHVGITLSSGFSDPEKVEAFNFAEDYDRMKLYDSIGAGFLDGVRCSTADIVAVGEEPDQVDAFVRQTEQRNIVHKVGRPPQHNKTLERIL
jgi:nicotinic acid phosphoribosyltransferase